MPEPETMRKLFWIANELCQWAGVVFAVTIALDGKLIVLGGGRE